MAMPRGLALGSVSGIVGNPVEEEKRTVIGVDVSLKCGADVSSEAAEAGTKVPVRRWPLAWAVSRVRVSAYTKKGKSRGRKDCYFQNAKSAYWQLMVFWKAGSPPSSKGYTRRGDAPGLKLCGASPAMPRSVLTRPLLVSNTRVSVESGILDDFKALSY